ncbi:hypothetical protein BUALT_Bualt01G0101600 [Buddleja alternifolia]|uniref:Plant thionin family protein n=1 Tax=Buddleja alternifolia TaxID=168488 RepID=A0AAV6YBW8_9LAMI|nr:hypothetical protein BUALT_Bualt01G0101600 [Buddleja alternifolia]
MAVKKSVAASLLFICALAIILGSHANGETTECAERCMPVCMQIKDATETACQPACDQYCLQVHGKIHPGWIP